MKRSPLRRKQPWNPKRLPMRQRSDKQEALYKIRRPMIREAMERGQLCQACIPIADVDIAAANRCGIRAVDCHERVPRGRGGSIIDPSNFVWVCRSAHNWIHDHPREAEIVGLLAR